MIVAINENNNSAYQALFQKAYNTLKEAGIEVEGNNGTITSLDEYFSHMADFLEQNKYEFMLVPTDEEPCVINANTREIKVPAAFTKCAGLENDHMAEMVTFVIDRYFDYIDFANMTIYVQWTATDENKALVEGASYVNIIDRETIPNKIRFGWPLVDEITQYPGVIKFSVRFFKKENNKIVYSFNTQDASLTIKKSLQPEVNAEADAINADNFFRAAVVNSMYPGSGLLEPQTPRFAAPGQNLVAGDAALVDDTLSLEVQAIKSDAGELTYRWYYANDTESGWKNVQENGFGTVEEEYKKSNPASLTNGDIYYVRNEGSPISYSIYTGKTLPTDGTQLYERYSKYTVPAEGEITGSYKATVTNTVGKATTPEVSSNIVTLPGPDAIVFSQNLTDGYIIKDEEAGVKLAAKANAGAGYKWFYTQVENGEMVEIDDAIPMAGGTYVMAKEPGWYEAMAAISKNRKTNELYSIRAKVTKMPVAPEVTYSATNGGNILLNEDATFQVSLAEEYELLTSDPLFSEGITYRWQVQFPDEDWRDVVKADEIVYDIEGTVIKGFVVSGVDTATLTVRNLKDGERKSFRCIITNVLNGELAQKVLTPDEFFIS